MIRLDIDLSYLTKNFEIGTQRLNQYGTKSIDEIMEAEAAQGNTKAESFQRDVINDPKELVKLFKLSNAKNRYAILSQMNSSDLEYLVNFLEPEDLQMGLMFFTKTKILNNHKDIYKKIIENRNVMESKALTDLEHLPEWQIYLLEKNQLDYNSESQSISFEDWSLANQKLETLRFKIISNYIDSQSDETIYGVLRNGLKTLKQRNINLPNISQMEFDLWRQIVNSAELAELTIAQITNSSEYMDSVKNDKIIRDYQVRNHFRK